MSEGGSIISATKTQQNCNELAKAAVDVLVARKIMMSQIRSRQLLPFESVALMVKGKKFTGDIAEMMRFAKGSEQARDFLVKQKGWTDDQFDEVDWTGLHQALKRKADGFKIWLSKQHSGFCDTRVKVGHYSGDEEADVSCPNCGQEENAANLCVCTNTDRTRLFRENLQDLKVWLNKHGNIEPQLAYWIPKYLLGRGAVKFENLGHMSQDIEQLAF